MRRQQADLALNFGEEASSQLLSADPASWASGGEGAQAHALAPEWQALVAAFWRSARGQALQQHLQARLQAGATIFPPDPLRALALTPLHSVRCVVLGQDPYHGRGQAEGLAFSVAPGVKLPPSLRNIYKEIARDLGHGAPAWPVPGGSLVHWAEQGVLLLNTCLTVEEGAPASHAGKGWEALTDAVITEVAQKAQPVVFLLWGAHAQSKAALIAADRGHLVLMSNHPSPLSAQRPPVPFIGNGHFSQARDFGRAQPGGWNAAPF